MTFWSPSYKRTFLSLARNASFPNKVVLVYSKRFIFDNFDRNQSLVNLKIKPYNINI